MDTQTPSFENYRVLLYYHYVPIADPQGICDWQIQLCANLDLKGRIRIAPEGLNGTLGGSEISIQQYIQHMKNMECLHADSVDWKISGAVTRYAIESQQFDSLSCKVTKEVVSLDLTKKEYKGMMEAGPGHHLSPQAFHNEIEKYINAERSGVDVEEQPLVLLDVRNIYETEIGRFDISDKGSVPVVDPQTRKFSEFKKYIDTHIDDFENKKVLMYCTGGVKCERASAYLRLRAPTSCVYQLTGGIHNYQEAFPDGGFFHGKNFVYDPRKAVPCKNVDEIIGKCRLCDMPYDDYASQVRCKKCRMLQLVCDTCREQDPVFIEKGVVCTMCSIKI